jgi:hypothetical protein
MIPPRVLTFAVFSAAIVAAVWWSRQRQLAQVRVVRVPSVPWTDLT